MFCHFKKAFIKSWKWKFWFYKNTVQCSRGTRTPTNYSVSSTVIEKRGAQRGAQLTADLRGEVPLEWESGRGGRRQVRSEWSPRARRDLTLHEKPRLSGALPFSSRWRHVVGEKWVSCEGPCMPLTISIPDSPRDPIHSHLWERFGIVVRLGNCLSINHSSFEP